MTGSESMPGLTPRAISEMFRLISERPHCTSRISTYFVELYNDNLVVIKIISKISNIIIKFIIIYLYLGFILVT